MGRPRGPRLGAVENRMPHKHFRARAHGKGLLHRPDTVNVITGALFLLKTTLDTSCYRSVTEGKSPPQSLLLSLIKQPTRIYGVLVIMMIMNI